MATELESTCKNSSVAGDMNLLVQFNKSANSIALCIVNGRALCGAAGTLARNSEVLLRDGGETQRRRAKVLQTHQQEECLLAELRRLKRVCFEHSFDETDEDTTMRGDPWLLVQYSCSQSHLVYAVLRFSETVGRETNKYSDVLAYLSDGDAIYQAIILRKAHKRRDLDGALRRIAELCASTQQVPLQDGDVEGAVGPIIRQPFAEVVPAEQQPVNGDDRLEKQLRELEAIEAGMQREVCMIADAFEAIDNTRRAMEQRLSMLSSP